MPLPQLNRNKTGGWVLIGGAIICAALFLNEVFGVVQALRAKQWPTVTGTVIESRAAIGCGKGSSYYPFVRYEYTFQSQAYVGRRVAFGNVGCGTEHDARKAASAFPPGQTVRVWVNPTAPDEAALLVGNVLRESWFGIGILPIFILGGYFMGRALLRQESAA